jgi:hypothetical protein
MRESGNATLLNHSNTNLVCSRCSDHYRMWRMEMKLIVEDSHNWASLTIQLVLFAIGATSLFLGVVGVLL